MIVPGLFGVVKPSTYDPDAAAFFAVVAAGGGTISDASKLAYSNYINSGKVRGWFSKVLYELPMLGDFTAMKLARVNGLGTSTPTFDSFVSGDWTEATGLIGDGSTKKIQFGFEAPTPTGGLAAYDRIAPAGATNQAYLGSQGGTDAYRLGRTNSNGDDSLFYGKLVAGPTLTIASRAGFFHGYRSSSVLAKLWRNGTQIGGDYTTSTVAAAAGFNLYGFSNNSSGTASNYLHSSSRMCYFGITTGTMSDTEAGFYGADNLTLQTALSRNV